MLRSPIAGLAVGLVIGFVVGVSTGLFDSKVNVVDAEGLSPPRSVGDTHGGAVQARLGESPNPLVELQSPSVGSRTAAEAGLVVKAERAIEGLRGKTQPVGKGEGKITGRVIDTEGLPLAGVVVQAIKSRGGVWRQSASGGVADTVPSEIAAALAEGQLREIIESHESMREVTTGADGNYELIALEDCGWNLKAYRKGYACQPMARYASGVHPGAQVTFVGEPVFRTRVSVVGPDGKEVPSASLLIKPGPRIGLGSGNLDWSREDPMLSLGEGTWEVRAVAEPMGGRPSYGSSEMTAFASKPQIIHMPSAAGGQPLRLRLASRAGIAGTVRVMDPRILPTMWQAKLTPCVLGEEPDLEALEQSSTRAMITGGRGFSFSDLTPGRYVVGVSLGWRGAIVAHEVVEVEGPTRVELKVAELDLSRYLLVRAVGPQGAALRDAKYKIDTSGKASGGRARIVSATRSTLGGDLVELGDAALGGGAYKLIVEHELFGSQTVTVSANTREISVQLKAPASLTVTLTGASGDSAAGLSVTTDAGATGPFLSQSASGIPGPDGRVELKGLNAGEQVVVLSMRARGTGVSYGSAQLGQWTTLLQPGPNELQIAVPSTYGVSIQAPDEKPGERVMLIMERNLDGKRSASGISGALDAGGTATIQGLPAGSYRVRVGKSRGTVDVPGGPVLIYREQ